MVPYFYVNVDHSDFSLEVGWGGGWDLQERFPLTLPQTVGGGVCLTDSTVFCSVISGVYFKDCHRIGVTALY